MNFPIELLKYIILPMRTEIMKFDHKIKILNDKINLLFEELIILDDLQINMENKDDEWCDIELEMREKCYDLYILQQEVQSFEAIDDEDCMFDKIEDDIEHGIEEEDDLYYRRNFYKLKELKN